MQAVFIEYINPLYELQHSNFEIIVVISSTVTRGFNT